MEMFGKTLCITFDELVRSGIMSKSNFDKHVRERKFQVLQKGGNGRKVLVAYETLSDALRSVVEKKLPDIKKQLKKGQINPMNIRLKSDDKAVEFYKTYTPKISIDRQKEYVLNAKVMNAMIVQETGLQNKHSEYGYTHKSLVRNTVISLCEELRKSFNHTLPKSESRLIEKFRDYKKRGYVALVSGTTGNQSARKIGPREGRILLRLKRSKFPVYTDMEIFDEFNRIVAERNARVICEEDRLKPVESPQTVINYLYKTGIKLWWYGVVHGEIAFKNEFMPQFDTKLPQMPNTLWYGDGTKLNLYYKDYDKKNKRMVARTIDVYEVMDACSEMFLGYSFGAENFLTQYEAYRMALETWKVKPYEIVTDNQGGHKKPEAQAFFKKICHLHKTTMPHNGQSKTIESAFGRFQQQVMHKLYNYTGQNVTATKESSHVNIDLIMKNISQLPTLEEMKEHTFESLDPDFPKKVKPGDFVVGGENFGCGSSREQAPGVLKALGVQAVVAKSFARIFYRNAINIGLPVIVCKDLPDDVKTGDTMELSMSDGTAHANGKTYSCTKLPEYMQNILNQGGLIASLNREEE